MSYLNQIKGKADASIRKVTGTPTAQSTVDKAGSNMKAVTTQVAQTYDPDHPRYGEKPGDNSSPWTSMLDSKGNLQSKYVLGNPTALTAQSVSAGTLGSGGTLGYDQLKSGGTLAPSQLGNYDKVGVNSILGDTQGRLDQIKA